MKDLHASLNSNKKKNIGGEGLTWKDLAVNREKEWTICIQG